MLIDGVTFLDHPFVYCGRGVVVTETVPFFYYKSDLIDYIKSSAMLEEIFGRTYVTAWFT